MIKTVHFKRLSWKHVACKSHSYCPGDIIKMELYIKGQLFRSVEVGTAIPFFLYLGLFGSSPKCCWSLSVPHRFINSPFIMTCIHTAIVGNFDHVVWILYLVFPWFHQWAQTAAMAIGCTWMSECPSVGVFLLLLAEYGRFPSSWSWWGLRPTVLEVWSWGFPLINQTTNHLSGFSVTDLKDRWITMKIVPANWTCQIQLSKPYQTLLENML